MPALIRGCRGGSEPPEGGMLLPSWPPAPALSFGLPRSLPSARCWPEGGKRISLKACTKLNARPACVENPLQHHRSRTGQAQSHPGWVPPHQGGDLGPCHPVPTWLCPNVLPSLAKGHLAAGTGCAPRGWEAQQSSTRATSTPCTRRELSLSPTLCPQRLTR